MLAAQVVYTNVEENRSPHRRRGVQVWLWTESVPVAVREEVEQRVNTFARAGAEPFVRRIFTPLVAGEYVMLAEAVPLTKPDKFGRGGRFHTHALLVDRDKFTECGGDPFSVFDSGFAFQRDPDAVPDEVWKAIHLPEVNLTPTVPHAPPVPAACQSLVAELVAWLLADEPAGTVALPVPVADAEAVVRAVLRLLPPTARSRLSFDTLWTGKGKYAPRVGGAGSPQLLQAWTFRQFVRFDPMRKAVFPPLPVRAPWAKQLAEWWANTPQVTADDRAASLALAEWVDGSEPVPPQATPRAAEWVWRLPRAAERWEQAKQAAAGRAFPDLVRRLPGVDAKVLAYFGEWGAEGVSRVRTGVPVDGLHWVLDAVLTPLPLDERTARAIHRWCGKVSSDPSERLYTVANRWLPEYHDYSCGLLRNPAPAFDWFRQYCRDTLPAELRGPDAADGLVRAFLAGEPFPTDAAEVCEAVASTDAGAEPRLKHLRLILRVHDRLGGNPDALLANDPELTAWADDHLLRESCRGYRWAALTVDGAPPDDWSHLFRGAVRPLALLGLRVPVTKGAGGRFALLNFLLQRHGFDFLRRVSLHLDRSRFPHADDTAPPDGERQWKECGKLFLKRDADGLAERLREADDLTYRRLANEYLFTHATGQMTFGVLPDGGSYFVGAAVSEFNPDSFDRTVPLIEALAGCAVPPVRVDSDHHPAVNERFVNRFGWLVVRLLTGVHSGSLGIPPR